MGIFGNITLGAHWQTADRSSSGIAPDPATVKEAVVQVYAARAFSWRGIFAVHTWIATKPKNAASFTVHEVLGWRAYRGMPVVSSALGIADRNWYGATPELLVDIRGPTAAALVPRVAETARAYPYPDEYVIWPGPNSNTFTAWVARETPELQIDLPTTAVGKDYLGGARIFDKTPSGTGAQFSLFGLVGVAAGLREGIEINVLGFSLGIDPLGLAIKLPGIGRLGMPSRTVIREKYPLPIVPPDTSAHVAPDRHRNSKFIV
jgi:hypothetical protein